MASLDVNQLRNVSVLSDEVRGTIRASYAREAEVVDGQIERFLDALDARGLTERSLIVFTSDHGEELWDHGGVEHGHSHLSEVIEVPLVLAGPTVPPGHRASTASLLDVPHTLLHAAGLQTDGIDLRDPIPADRIATAKGNLHHWIACSARDTRHRVIVEACLSREDRRMHAYDLVTDPEERSPVALPEDHRVRRAAEGVLHPVLHAEADQSTQALRALGYVE